MAVELAAAGHEVSVIARGAHLRAIRERGLTLRSAGAEKTVRVPASHEPRDFGPQDLVICTLKAHQAYAAAPQFAPLLGPSTAVLWAMNGIPWWYFYKSGGPFEGHRIESVDPDGRQWSLIGPERIVGCIVEPASEVREPGVIVHHALRRFIIGEPDGARTERLLTVQRLLMSAGFEAQIREGIRYNVWLKLWGNVCFNPIAALTGETLDRIVADPALRELCRAMMRETQAVNEALGVQIPHEMLEKRFAAAGRIGAHKMSMLQDLERGRSLEIDALVTVVQELGRLTAVPTPLVDAVLALVQARGRAAGVYQPLAPDGGVALAPRTHLQH